MRRAFLTSFQSLRHLEHVKHSKVCRLDVFDGAAPMLATLFATAAGAATAFYWKPALCEEAPAKLISVKKEGGNTTRDAQYKRDCSLVDLSSYNKVTVDLDRMIVTAGASVTMEQLSTECLAHGVVPLVVPEFKAITVGGAVMGAAVESSSGKYGEFSETCVAYKLRLGGGDVIDCSDAVNRDLFDALSGSYGSLALLLSADIRVMRATPQVRVSYKWFDDLGLAIRHLLQAARAHDFAEGLSYPEPGQGHVIITADFDASPPMPQTSILHPSDPWFYEHVLQTKGNTACELISTSDYLHRHERGAFWMARPQGEHVGVTPFGCAFSLLSTPPLRRFFDEYWKTTFLFRMLKAAPQATIADNFLITDIYTDPADVEALVNEVRFGQFTISTPIWFCPMRAPQRYQPLSPHGHRGGEDLILVDVGLYGRILGHRGIAAAKHYECWGSAHRARKMLYSQNYYSEEDFWTYPMFSKSEYQALRRKYGAEGTLVDLYKKVGSCEQSVERSRQEQQYRWWALLTRWT